MESYKVRDIIRILQNCDENNYVAVLDKRNNMIDISAITSIVDDFSENEKDNDTIFFKIE